MLRLTLRSRDDGRFLARVIERDGFAFVLDYGDPQTVADASERVARGFSVFHEGSNQKVPPTDKKLLHRLADYYEQEGLLVKLEEQNVASMAPQQSPFARPFNNPEKPAPLHDALSRPITINDGDFDDETELVPIDVSIGEQVTVIRKVADLDEETQRLDVPPVARRMWSPPMDPNAQTLTDLLERVPTNEREWEGSDDEETELVPLEVRRRVIRGEVPTELQTSANPVKPTDLSED